MSDRGGKRLPEGGKTLPIAERTPRIKPDTMDGRTTAPFTPIQPKGDDEEAPTRAGEMPGQGMKTLDVEDPRARTTLNQSRTIRDVPSRDPRDRILPDGMPQTTTQMVVSAPPSVKPEPEPAPVTAARERTKIWVATHRPPVDPDPRLILLREPDSQRAASFRVLRHRLQQKGDPRVIAVTSAEAGEGKSTCAANLAMALGECDRARVLLVEANLRSPSLAALFGFLPPTCFALQMHQHKEKPLDPWSVVEAFFPSLHVIAVKPGQESRPLLDGPAFLNAMAMLRNAGYDYLVLDTPPVLGSADVNLIEDACDGILFAAWSRKTSGRTLARAVEQLDPGKIVGITLLDV